LLFSGHSRNAVSVCITDEASQLHNIQMNADD